jgi:hypothetical protein
MYYICALTASGTSFSSFGKSRKSKSQLMVACMLTWQNKWVYKTITSNPCPHINAELLLVSTMDYIMKIFL